MELDEYIARVAKILPEIVRDLEESNDRAEQKLAVEQVEVKTPTLPDGHKLNFK